MQFKFSRSKFSHSKFSQWLLEIGFGVGLLLLCSTALELAMQHSPEMLQFNSFSRDGGDRDDSPATQAVEPARPLDRLLNDIS